MINEHKENPEKSVSSIASVAIVFILLFLAIAASGQNVSDGNLSAAESEADMLFMLLQIQADVQGKLNDLDSDLANAAQNLSTTRLEGPAARGVLRKLLETNSNLPGTLTFGTMNKEGKIITSECKGCENVSIQDRLSMHSAENLSPTAIELIAHVMKTKTPAFSKAFMTVEGFTGANLEYPVFSSQGEFMGGVGAVFEPDKLLNALVAPQLHFNNSTRSNITDYSFWIWQPDGLIAYDRDADQIGNNIFKDPLYKPFPSVLALGKKIIAERAGHGSYSFQVSEANKSVVTKDAYWTTAGLHGSDWRLIITRIMQ